MSKSIKFLLGVWALVWLSLAVLWVLPSFFSPHEVFAQATGPLQYSGPAQSAVIQPATTLNTETVSSANTAQTKSIAAAASKRVMLYGVRFSCSAGTATLTIKDGVAGTTIWSYVAAASQEKIFLIPLSSTVGNGMDITVGTCGASNTSTLDVQASQF